MGCPLWKCCGPLQNQLQSLNNGWNSFRIYAGAGIHAGDNSFSVGLRNIISATNVAARHGATGPFLVNFPVTMPPRLRCVLHLKVRVNFDTMLGR